MTSARLTISTASDRWRALRFNSRLSGGAKTTLPKLMPTNIQHTQNESLTYCTSSSQKSRHQRARTNIRMNYHKEPILEPRTQALVNTARSAWQTLSTLFYALAGTPAAQASDSTSIGKAYQ